MSCISSTNKAIPTLRSAGPRPAPAHQSVRASPRAAGGAPLEDHLELADLAVAPGEFGRSLPRAGGIRVTHRIHGRASARLPGTVKAPRLGHGIGLYDHV